MIHLCLTMICIGLLFYLAALYESAALGILAICISAVLLCSIAVILWRLCCIKVSISVPLALAESGQPFDVCLTTQAQRTLLGRCMLSVRMEAGSQRAGRGVRTWNRVTVEAARPQTFRRAVTIRYAGGYELRICRVRVYDWLGWFYLTRRVHACTQVQILPQVREFPLQLSFAVRNFSGESEIYDDLRGGDEAAETFQIREYQPGDRLQNIHWKLSVKAEDLIVRERGLSKGCPIVILLDDRHGRRQKAEQNEHFLQLAASVSFALLDAGCPYVVSWYDDSVQDLVRIRVDTEEDYYEWQVRYMSAGASRASVDVEARYQQKYRGEQLLHIVRITPEQKIWLDGSIWQDTGALSL